MNIDYSCQVKFCNKINPPKYVLFSISDSTKTIINNLTWSDKVKKTILSDYDRFVRPVEKGNATVVNVGLTIIHIDLDEHSSVMTVNGWTKLVKNY